MLERGLIDTINLLSCYWSADDNTLTFPDGFLTPGALVVLTAFAKSKNLAQERLTLSNATRGYVSAIGLSKALCGVDMIMNMGVGKKVRITARLNI